MAKITKIEKISLESARYDLQTTTNNFYANGILVHNSMITPVYTQHGVRWGTKMGITDVSMQAELFVVDHPEYQHMAEECLEMELTPIFEWCSRKQRIVVDYPEDRLVLIAMRDLHTGEYGSYQGLLSWGRRYGIEVVRQYPGTVANMEHLLAETHDLLGQEGWIIRFDDGHMLKLKGKSYVDMHRAKDSILRENGVIELILSEKLDDVKAFLPDADRYALEEFETKFYKGLNQTASEWAVENRMIRSAYGDDRKKFAMEKAHHLDPHLRGNVFKAWESIDYDWYKAVVEVVRKNIGTSTKVGEIRHLFGNAKWNYGSPTE
jgi:RNA ligase